MIDATSLARLAAARSFLFVPGNRPDRFDKALAAGADVVILDLEDAVGPDAKAQARSAIAAWLSNAHPVMLRINAVGSAWHEDDLPLASRAGVLGVMLPKAELGSGMSRVAALAPTIALIETARGVADLARHGPVQAGICRLALGDIDLALDLGVGSNGDVLDPIRLNLVLASRVAGLAPPIAGVSVNIQDLEGVRRDAERSKLRGFTGKLAIHPAQIAAIHAGLMPSAEEVERARRIVDVDRRAAGSAVLLDGQMIDRPVVERARRLLASLPAA